MRLFTAIDLPVTLRSKLAGMASAMHGVRWCEDDALHLTVRFIGEADTRRFHEIREALTEVSHKKFTLKPKGAGAFGSAGVTKVLWTGFEENEALKNLEKKICRVLSKFEIEDAARKFVPHITIGRLTNARPQETADWLAEHSLFQSEAFEAASFKLYSSHLQSRPRYNEEAEYFFE